MSALDDFPSRGRAQEIEAEAVDAFKSALRSAGLFQLRSESPDFGTDYQLEALQKDGVTNFRAQAQVKGSTDDPNQDGSVSVPVRRTNLNYLLSQPDSFYVCFHLPSERLLVAPADEAFVEHEAHPRRQDDQKWVTIRFRRGFDLEFQKRLHARMLARGRRGRDDRLDWAASPPDKIPARLREAVPQVEVPLDPDKAYEVLRALIDSGRDAVISAAFEEFVAVLGEEQPLRVLPAYLAEINCGMVGLSCDEQRVRKGLGVLSQVQHLLVPASFHYCVANGHAVLGEVDEAKDAYIRAQLEADKTGHLDISAQASKNLGSVLEDSGDLQGARACYERALELDPKLPEAHWALGLWLGRFGGQPAEALEHLDQVVAASGGSRAVAALSGWKARFLFETDRNNEAFREINRLLSLSSDAEWVWPWAGRLVATYGRSSTQAATQALTFWEHYLAHDPEHLGARREKALCMWKLRSKGEVAGVSLGDYEGLIRCLIEREQGQPKQVAFLWDRLGHWAQWEGDWKAAVEAYRNAVEIEPERYGYCLGTALNFLGEHTEALELLVPQAEKHMPDAMSWFQVGVALAGVGQQLQAAEAFKRAVDLDPDYDKAWFNLGGSYYMAGEPEMALEAWTEAQRRFPQHELWEQVPSQMRWQLGE